MVPRNTPAAGGLPLARPVSTGTVIASSGAGPRRVPHETDLPEPYRQEQPSNAISQGRDPIDQDVPVESCRWGMNTMHTSPSGKNNFGNGTEMRGAGVGAAAASAPSSWRPLVIRAVIGATALLGLSAIGAGSILLGLDGAHASPPTISSAGPSVSMRATEPGPPPSEASSSTANVAASANVQAPTQDCPAFTEDGRVILNVAGADALRRLPGIGPKRAESILQLRAKLKRFKRSTDLLRVRGIGPKSLARMQSHFVLDPPVGTACAANAQAAQ